MRTRSTLVLRFLENQDVSSESWLVRCYFLTLAFSAGMKRGFIDVTGVHKSVRFEESTHESGWESK